MAAGNRWTEEEDLYLIENYRSTRYEDLVAGLPQRTKSSIKNRIFKLQKNGAIPETKWWTEEEIAFLCDNWKTSTAKDIANHLGRTEWAVIRKIEKLRNSGQTNATKKPYKLDWSDIEDSIIVENYSSKTLAEIALLLNRSVSSVARRQKALGLDRKPNVGSGERAQRVKKKCQTCNKTFLIKENETKRLDRGKYCSLPCRQMGTRKTKPSKEDLLKLYFDERKSAKDIAKAYSVSDRTVAKWLDSYGIRKRSNSEAQSIPKVQTARITTASKNSKESPAHGGGVGKRKDLNNQFFRSGWEANFARVLNYQGIEWEYEPKVFSYENIKRGSVAYTPDFYIPNHPEYGPIWIEVKGRMHPGTYSKLLNFKRQYKSDFDILMGIVEKGSKAYKSFEKLGIPILFTYSDMRSQFKDRIPNWEGR